MLSNPNQIQKRYESIANKVVELKLSDAPVRSRERRLNDIVTELDAQKEKLYELYNWVERACASFNELDDSIALEQESIKADIEKLEFWS